jgi:hypothetical protein
LFWFYNALQILHLFHLTLFHICTCSKITSIIEMLKNMSYLETFHSLSSIKGLYSYINVVGSVSIACHCIFQLVVEACMCCSIKLLICVFGWTLILSSRLDGKTKTNILSINLKSKKLSNSLYFVKIELCLYITCISLSFLPIFFVNNLNTINR